MPVFQYKAITSQGENVERTYQAKHEDEVIDMLRQNQYYPVFVKEVREDSKLMNAPIFSRVNIKDIAVFCRQFYTMLQAGVPIVTCLDVLKAQTENKKFKNVISDVYTNIQMGVTLSDALRNHRKVIPELLINMIEAGEVSGNLDGIMNRMAIHYEKETKINNKVRAAMVYPTILSIVSLLVIIFLLTFVMPTFLNMFGTSGMQLPLPTRILLSISNSLTNFWFVYLIVLFVSSYGFLLTLQNEASRKVIDGWKLKIPIIKSTVQKVITSRFTRTLSTLLYSGIPLIQALESASKVSGNKMVEAGIREAIEDISKGVNLAVPIKRMGIFPPMVISMIQIGEESGALDEILDTTANFYDEETEAAIQKITTLLEPLMIVIMALVIGFIVISMILPMFDLLNTV